MVGADWPPLSPPQLVKIVMAEHARKPFKRFIFGYIPAQWTKINGIRLSPLTQATKLATAVRLRLPFAQDVRK
jgi:hypothetical protein